MSSVNSARVLPAPKPAPCPSSLTIRFSTAHDLEALSNLFHGSRKQELDPTGKVRARSQAELEGPISNGDALLATDTNGAIRFFAMASDHYQHKYDATVVTEIGGIMSDVGGFKLTQIASAMLALRQTIRLREQLPCLKSHGLHALVADDNTPAKKVFQRDLEWAGVACDTRRSALFETQGKYSSNDDRKSRIWYGFNGAAIVKARDLVMKTLHDSALHSTKTGQTIPVSLDEKMYTLV